MKPTPYILLFIVTLLLPFALRATLHSNTPHATSNAPRLIILTPNNQDIRQEFARAFSAWHQSHYGTPVTCDFRVPGGAADIKRQLDLSYRHRSPDAPPDYDVLWGGGDYFFDQELKPLHLFQPLGLPPQLLHEVYPQPTLAGVRLYDASPDPQWAGVALSGFGIAYNPSLYATLHLPPPQTWSDLTTPKLSGLLALADPSHSGSVALAYAMILQRAMADEEQSYLAARPQPTPRSTGVPPVLTTPAHPQPPSTRAAGVPPASSPSSILPPPFSLSSDPAYRAALARGWKRGMSTLLLLAANARPLTASATQVPADVAAADAAAGISIDLYARVTAETLGDARLRFVLPKDATAVTPDPVAILAGVTGDRLTLSRHFVEFLLSKEGQLLWSLKPGSPQGPRDRALRRSPIRRDVYTPDRSNWSDPTDDPFSAASTFNQRPEWLTQFADWRALWRCAWIDARDDLKRAYSAILSLPDTPRRADLLTRLSTLPIEMSDLDALRAARKQLQSTGGDLELFREQTSISWTTRFRAHYNQLERDARQQRTP